MLTGMADQSGAETASLMYEEEARRWAETGALQWCGSNAYAFTKLRCWLDSNGAKAEGVSERLQHYYAAAEAKFEESAPEWYDKFLRTKDWCSICGETYRLENLSLCTHCDVLLGYCHTEYGNKTANGNPKCPTCKSGEIVG